MAEETTLFGVSAIIDCLECEALIETPTTGVT